MLNFLVKLVNIIIACFVNLLTAGLGVALGAFMAIIISSVTSTFIVRASLRWCHARVARNDDCVLDKNELRDFTFKAARIREKQSLWVYLLILAAMVALYAYLIFGGVFQTRYYIGAAEGLHIMYTPLSVYAGTIVISVLIFLSDIHSQGYYYFDLDVPAEGERVLTLGDKGYRVGITLDEKGKIVHV